MQNSNPYTQAWLQRWQNNQIGFHEARVNVYLARYLERFNLQSGDHIFLPLCGKAHDIAWLADQGYKVTGIELSSIAVEAFFRTFKLSYQRLESDQFIHYDSDNIRLLVGDYFDLQVAYLEDCQLVFDRAALIAMDAANRARYGKQMINITLPGADILLVTLNYDQSVMSGPPFAVSEQEVIEHYQLDYKISVLEQQNIIDEQPRWRQKGLTKLIETVFQLRSK